MTAIDAQSTQHIATSGSLSGRQVGVLLQPTCVSLVEGRAKNGLDLSWEHARLLGAALIDAAERGERQQGKKPEPITTE